MTKDWWDVQFTMVLQRENITMRKQKCQAVGIPLQPELGHENRGRDAIRHKRIGDTAVKCARAGIERESNGQAI